MYEPTKNIRFWTTSKGTNFISLKFIDDSDPENILTLTTSNPIVIEKVIRLQANDRPVEISDYYFDDLQLGIYKSDTSEPNEYL